MKNVTPKPVRARAYEVMMGLLGILFIVSALVMLAVGGVIIVGGTAMLTFGRRIKREDRA